METFRFNEAKDQKLKETRGVSFRDIIKAIKEKNIIDIIDHPNKKIYKNQKIYLVKINNYVYAVPFIEEKDFNFLKTIYPSHRYTTKYLKVTQKIV